MLSLLSVNVLLSVFGRLAYAEVAIMGRQPLGINPTLYDPKADPIMQLDEMTFNDTVFCKRSSPENCTAFVVEFYSDWCGHCRAYAQTYKSLARDLQGWDKVIRIAAMNCADPLNEVTCQANDVQYYPYIKYFPRNSTSPQKGMLLKPLQTESEMRDVITESILVDYGANHFPDWPDFDFLGNVRTYSELWRSTNKSAPLLVIIFEETMGSLIGAELLLDMTKYDDRVVARRCLKNHPLAEALYIKDFPTMAIFKREQRTPLLVAELRRLLFGELERFMISEDNENEIEGNIIQNRSLCERDIVKCRQRFFVSETDMLKAMRYATVEEVVRSGKQLIGSNLTAIRNFLDLLAQDLPNTTIYYNISDENRSLSHSERAKIVFGKMRDYLDQRGLHSTIPVTEYKEQFIKLEEENGDPFPTQADWEHCAGSNPQFRGYTCGLWTTFHALTVQAYKNNLNNTSFVIRAPLAEIRDWVDHFFGCQRCRDHFIRMTTRTFRMESHVHRPEDLFMYLWQAHNIVNARLRGRDTEDPEFPKRQFPSDFLCANCRQEGHFNEDEVKNFLLVYYAAIRPYQARKQQVQSDFQ